MAKIDYPAHLEEMWQKAIAPREANAPTVVSTFAGGGGSLTGYMMAGFRDLLAVEWDNNAVETLRLNWPELDIYHGDIAKLSVEEVLQRTCLQPGELDILDGSPPCQGFSTAGKRIMDDPRNQLFREYVRLLRGLQPKVFIMENVSGMVKGKMKLVFVDILKELKASGYQVSAKLLNAMYFHVPQSRQRMIFIGVRNDLGIMPSHPKGESREICARDALPVNPDGIHLPSKYVPIWEATKPGESFGDGNERLIGKQTSFAAKKIHPLKASNSITKQIMVGLSGLHRWDYPCLLSGLELRRLGSFPDCYLYNTDDETSLNGYRMVAERIGNSVPPLFMEAIARHVRAEILDKVYREGTVNDG